MTESIKNQYIHFIQYSKSAEGLKYLEDKIKRNYGLIPDDVNLEITKATIRIQNAKIAKDDEILKAQNEHINKLKCQKPY